jgi:hypothetical protein
LLVRAHETATAFAAGALAATVLVWAPGVSAEPAAEPRYRADQIAQIETADIPIAADTAQRVHHDGAAFIKARFDGVHLGSGDTITVASPDGGESYDYGAADLEDGGLRALSIEGDTAVVTLHDTADGTDASARLAAYSRGLDDAELASRPSEREAGPESICGRDDSRNAVCYQETDPVAWNASRSVARLIIDDETFCTAWLADDANRLMTNNHCFSTDGEAQVTEVQFQFECVQCAGGDTRRPLKVVGEEVLVTDYELDFTLFTVADYAEIAHLPHLRIATRDPDIGEKVFIPEHPGGRPLRIAADSSTEPAGTGSQCQVLDNRAEGNGWNTDLSYFCDTAGGSSGSPVLSRTTGAVVGLHHLGGCPNGAARMDLVYPMIARYLDYDL